MSTARSATWFTILSMLVADASADDLGYVDATYNPTTGRIVVTVVNATWWTLVSIDDSPLFTGPDNAVQNGILPTRSDLLDFYHTPTFIGEVLLTPFVPQLNYGPLDLGRVAQLHIPMGKMIVWCECPFRGSPTDHFEVRYVPEPGTLAVGWLAACLGLFRRHPRNSPAQSTSIPVVM